MITKLLLISVICTLIIDSGFFDEIEDILSKKYFKGKVRVYFGKVFHCAQCATTWTSIAYLFITANLTLENLCIVLILGYLTAVISGAFRLVLDYLQKLICDIADRFGL